MTVFSDGSEPSANGVARAEAAKQVKAALRGPVMRLLAEGLPEVRAMPGMVAYEKVMGDIGLLEQCFHYFRSSRESFAAVLVDGQSRQVNDDDARLSCGRTLNEIIAMIVRSAAFRYFNQRMGDRRPLTSAKPGLLERAKAMLGHGSNTVQVGKSKAELLYDAIRQYLLYEWQVPLVPAYSQLSPGDVNRLGPRLVELRSEDALFVAAGRRAPPPPSPIQDWSVKPPSPASQSDAVVLAEILTADKARLDVEAFAATLADAEVKDAAANAEQASAVNAALKQVSAGLIKSFCQDLGLGKRQLAVCLLSAQRLLPPSAFEQWARASENAPSTMRFMASARKAKLGKQTSLADCAAAMAVVFPPPSG